MLSVLEEADITVNQNGTTRFTSDENLLNKTDLFQPEIRVYLLNMYSNHAREVLCAVSLNTCGRVSYTSEVIALYANYRLQKQRPGTVIQHFITVATSGSH